MTYSLWDSATANLIGRWDDEAGVRAAVRELIDQFGDRVGEEFLVGRVAENGTILSPLKGVALLAWASR